MQPSNYRKLKNAQYSIVHKTNKWYESFPDIELTDDRFYICSFTRATFHGGFHRSIMISRSEDGIQWSPPVMIARPRNRSYNFFILKKLLLEEYDCSKIQKTVGQQLEISVALSDVDGKRNKPALFVFRSLNNGNNWLGPIELNCQGLVQDDFLVNKHNPRERIVGMHLRDKRTHALSQYIYRSLDNGITWKSPEVVASDGITHFCEASISYIPGTNIIVAFMRDNRREKKKVSTFFGKGYPTQICFSKDFGKNWTKPIITSINGHRPVAKFLNDGRILVTYRDIFHLGITGLWIADINPEKIVFTPEDSSSFNEIFSNKKYYIIEKEDKFNAHGDNGYTGWVQDPIDDKILVVYYTKVGATVGKVPFRTNDKRAYIKSVLIRPDNL